MATLALTFYLAENPMSYFMTALAYAGASYVDSKLFPGPNVEGSRLNDLSLQASSYGAPVQKVYGTARASGTVIWGTNFVEHKKTEKQGKGGSSTTYTYSVSFAVSLCKGPIAGIGRIWADGKLFADLTGKTFSGDGTISGTYEGKGGGRFTVYKGTETQLPDPFIEGIDGVGNVPAYRPFAYIVFQNLYCTDFGNRLPNFNFEIFSTVNDLADAITGICRDAGLADSDFDTADLTGKTISGYTTDGGKTFRSQIEPLQSVFIFDGVERNGVLTFSRRKEDLWNIPVYALDDGELGAYETERPAEPYNLTRKPEQELPARVVYSYLSKDREYQTSAMGISRLNTTSKNTVKTDLPVVLTDAEGKSLAETALYNAWIQRTGYELKLANKYACVFPGDIMLLPQGSDKPVFLFAQKCNYGKPGINAITAARFIPALYKEVARTTDPEYNQTPPAPPTAITANFLDQFYAFGETDETPLYVATTAAIFHGANIFRSNDGGLTWEFVTTTLISAAAGQTVGALAAGPVDIFDEANTVDVVLIDGSLTSRTHDDVLNGYNIALVGNEILQFRTATLIAAKTYRLSGLLRGRSGTEKLVGSHAAGDRFILLTTGGLTKIATTSADWFAPVLYRVGPANYPVTDPLYSNVTYTSDGTVAKPWAPCHLAGTRAGSGNLTASWIRRSRKDFSWLPYVDAALGETSELYEVDIYNGAAVVRTIQSTTSTITYTAAQQTADFGSAQASVTVKVYQISEKRGRGWPAEGAI